MLIYKIAAVLIFLAGLYLYGHHEGWAERDAEMQAAARVQCDLAMALDRIVGRIDLLNRPAFAVVGSRNATAQGLSNAEAFAASLSHAGLTVTSGLALGIDAAAHKGALETGGQTIAVLGGGVDNVALDALVLEHAVQPEAVEPGLLAHHDGEQRAGARPSSRP